MKYLLAVILAVFLAGPCWALSGDAKTIQAYTNSTSSGSIELVAATSGRHHEIFGIEFSLDTADELTLLCGSTDKMGFHLGATSGVIFNFFPLYIQCADNEAININKVGGSSDAHITVFYTTE